MNLGAQPQKPTVMIKRCGSHYPNTTDNELIYFNFYLLRSVPWIHFFQIGMGRAVILKKVQGTTASKKSVSHSVALWLCNPKDCSLPGSSVHGILQARILEWIAIHFSRDHCFYTWHLLKAHKSWNSPGKNTGVDSIHFSRDCCFYTWRLLKAHKSWVKKDTVKGICMITDTGVLLCDSYLSPWGSNSPSAVLIDNVEKFNHLLLNTKSFSSSWFYRGK